MNEHISHEEWRASELAKLGLSKAVCPHCGNDNQDLMAENWHFTHGQHKALNYQCHNPECRHYFQIGPLSECPCGWNREEAEVQKQAGKTWSWALGNYAYRRVSGKMIGTHEWETYLPDETQNRQDVQQILNKKPKSQ